MTISLENAVCYDIETFPNCFTLDMEMLHSDECSIWEISHFRDDRQQLFQWFNWLNQTQTPMIGYYSEHFDYPVIHWFYRNPLATVEQIYEFAMRVINSKNRFAHTVWQSDRFAPQIDLFKVHHFDNPAKSTSLKVLAINMRSENVMDMPVPVGTVLSHADINDLLIPYNRNDVKETKQFANYSMNALEFRLGLLGDLKGDVLNFNDTKIGAKILEQRIGEDVCYTRVNGRKEKRQTVRNRIALNDIIFPYVQFQHPEFQRVLDFMRQQVLTPDDLEDPDATIKTKGVFSGLHANVGGVEFKFGTGGIHASVPPQRIVATERRLIRDIDVAAQYPNVGIKNRLAPAHLGERFVTEYARLPEERKEWQVKKGKKCVEANSLKLASNGTYGNTNSKFSVFYDPQYTMTITINGQLLLCMLAEWLIMEVPTFQIIQANTDGITYLIDAEHEPKASEVCRRWEAFTLLELESVGYSRMWIRDVNNYIAENMDGSLKQKGAYWFPDPQNYAKSISETQPPAWHKDLGGLVIIKAALASMVHGIDVETFIRCHNDPFDFMLRVKVDKASRLMHGDDEIQKTTRYYVARDGAPLRKISPPAKGAQVGDFKRASKIPDAVYNQVMREIGPGVHDNRIHTKNKSKYEMRETNIQSGWKASICNLASDFSFDNVNFDYYYQEARKLVI